MKKKYEWDENIPVIEAHSLTKHKVLEEYIRQYILIVGRGHFAQKRLSLTLVDGFAGGGIYELPGTKEIHNGSPLILLNIAKETEFVISQERNFELDARFIFVEKEPKIFKFLENVLHTRGFREHINKTIYLINSEFENSIDKIICTIKERGRAWRSIFVLDQYGYTDVTMATLRKIFSELPSAEVILTLSVDFMTRYMNESPEYKKILHKIESSYDLSRLPEDKAQRNWRHLIQHNSINDFKQKSGARYFTNFFIKSSESNSSYWLLHLSMHEKARDVMQTLHWELKNAFVHEGKSGLFMLGYDANKDPNLTGQTSFLFTENDAQLNHKTLLEEIPSLLDYDGMQVNCFLRDYCNDTPSTFEMMKSAMSDLQQYGEIIIKGEKGQIRKKGVKLQNTDIVALNRQTSFFNQHWKEK